MQKIRFKCFDCNQHYIVRRCRNEHSYTIHFISFWSSKQPVPEHRNKVFTSSNKHWSEKAQRRTFKWASPKGKMRMGCFEIGPWYCIWLNFSRTAEISVANLKSKPTLRCLNTNIKSGLLLFWRQRHRSRLGSRAKWTGVADIRTPNWATMGHPPFRAYSVFSIKKKI